MKTFMKKERMVRLTVNGREKKRIFETEIHKKKFLDAVQDVMDKAFSIYGYCVLDDMGCLLVQYKRKETIEEVVQDTMQCYQRKLLTFDPKAVIEWELQIEPCAPEALWEELLKLHHLPVKEDYTIWPEFYWWSSYQEYLGRKWMSYQIPQYLSREKEIRREHKEWKKQHPEIMGH